MEGIHGVDVSWLHHSQKGKPYPRLIVLEVNAEEG